MSRDLIEKLTADQTKLWAEYYKGKPITQKQMAGLLKAYLIFPETVHLGKTLAAKGMSASSSRTPGTDIFPPTPTPIRPFVLPKKNQ